MNKISKLWDMYMLFHYGNCKKEIETLKKNNSDCAQLILKLQDSIYSKETQITHLLTQERESRAIYDYQVGDLEKKIKLLEKEINDVGAQSKIKVTDIQREVDRLNLSLNRSQDATDHFMKEASRYKKENEELKESLAISDSLTEYPSKKERDEATPFLERLNKTYEDRYHSLINENKSLTSELESLKSQLSVVDQPVNTIDESLKDLVSTIQELKGKKKKNRRQVVDSLETTEKDLESV